MLLRLCISKLSSATAFDKETSRPVLLFHIRAGSDKRNCFLPEIRESLTVPKQELASRRARIMPRNYQLTLIKVLTGLKKEDV